MTPPCFTVGTVYRGSSLLFFERLTYFILSDENKLYYEGGGFIYFINECNGSAEYVRAGVLTI